MCVEMARQKKRVRAEMGGSASPRKKQMPAETSTYLQIGAAKVARIPARRWGRTARRWLLGHKQETTLVREQMPQSARNGVAGRLLMWRSSHEDRGCRIVVEEAVYDIDQEKLWPGSANGLRADGVSTVGSSNSPKGRNARKGRMKEDRCASRRIIGRA